MMRFLISGEYLSSCTSHIFAAIHPMIFWKYWTTGISGGSPTIHLWICSQYLTTDIISLNVLCTIASDVKIYWPLSSSHWLSCMPWNLEQFVITIYSRYNHVYFYGQVHWIPLYYRMNMLSITSPKTCSL